MENNSKSASEEGVNRLNTLSAAKKSFLEMTIEEQKAAAQRIVARAKELNFAHGLPITYEKDGFVVDEYSDGRLVRLQPIKTPSIHQ